MEQTRGLRGSIIAKLGGAVVLTAIGAYAIHGALGAASQNHHARRTPHRPSVAPIPTLAASARDDALAILVTGAQCQVFVRDPGGDVLINRMLGRGESVYYDDSTLEAVIGDASAAKVYVNGVLQSQGPAGQQATFTVVKGRPTTSPAGPTPGANPSTSQASPSPSIMPSPLAP